MGIGYLNDFSYSYAHVAGAANTTVKTGSGILHAIVINTPATGNITIFDNTTNSGTIVAIINSTTSIQPQTILYDITFSVGCTVSTAASQDVTIVYG
jgi:hypothetical protein